MRYLLSLGCALLPIACSEEAEPTNYEPAVRRIESFALERMYAVRRGASIAVGGFSGSTPPNTPVRVIDGAQTATATADGDGRFALTLASQASTLTFELGDTREDFRVRDWATAHAAAVGRAITGVGSVPNDLEVLSDGRAFVARSTDDAIGALSANGEVLDGLRLPELPGKRGASPWFLRESDGTLFVTAYGHDSVYAYDAQTRALVATYTLEGDITLDTSYELSRAFDVDGDGTLETEVSRFHPRGTQGLWVTRDSVFATFTSVLPSEPNLDAVVLPGVVARWTRDQPGRPPLTRVLRYLNPQEVRMSPRNTLWVVCSGALARRSGPTVATTPGAMIELDPATLQELSTVELGDFGPSSALESGGELWVSSLVKARVRRIRDQVPLEPLEISSEAVDSIFRLTPLFDDLVLVPSFDTDTLHVFDLKTQTLDPPPFFEAFILGPGAPIIAGLQITSTRPGRMGVDFQGPDTFALLGLASEVIPMELRKLLGP